MKDIDQLRYEVDKVNLDMKNLFQKRLKLTMEIWKIKKIQSMSFFDEARETKIIHRFDSEIENPIEKKSVQNFFKSVIHETKTFLESEIK